MFDKTYYGHLFTDRQFYEITDPKEVKYYNFYQVVHSNRCIFADENNFESAKKYCEDHPEQQAYQPEIEVL